MDEFVCNASFMKEVCMLCVTLAVAYDTFFITPLSYLYEAMENFQVLLSQSNMQVLNMCNETIMILRGVH